MGDELPPKPTDDRGLQFDRVESSPAIVATCAACKRPIGDTFYLTGPKKVCPTCVQTVQSHQATGSGKRFFMALLLGGLAAIIGGLIWAFITYKSEGTVYGLVAIGLGYLVGLGVRKGSNAQGGRGYQFLALGLTYLGIAIGYVGAAVPDLGKGKPATEAHARAEPKADPAKPGTEEAKPVKVIPAPATGCLAALVVVVGLCLGSPVLVGIESPVTLLFLGIAFWEAWKLNKGLRIDFKGPFKAGAAGG